MRNKTHKNKKASGLTIENIQEEFPYKTTTVVEIKHLLDKLHVTYSSKAKKEELYGLLMIAILEQ